MHGAWIHSWHRLDGTPNCHLVRTWRVSPPIPANPNPETGLATCPNEVQPLWQMPSMTPVVIRLGKNPALPPLWFRKQPEDGFDGLNQEIEFLNRNRYLYYYSTQTKLVSKRAESRYVKTSRMTLVKWCTWE